jgi:hypothetical protein
MIDPALTSYFEGKRTADSLPPDERRAAARWDALLAEARVAPPHSPLLEARVMASIGARRPSRRPAIVAVAALAAALLLAVLVRPPAGPVPRGGSPLSATGVPVLFQLAAPGARTVAVAGSFSEWEPVAALDDADGDGIWTARVAILPGMHEYMFLVDGTEWVVDPAAERFVDDGFGQRNGLITISALHAADARSP